MIPELPTALSGAHARGRSVLRRPARGRRNPINGVWPSDFEFKPLDPVVLGTAPAPIDDDTLADCCILLAVIAKTKPERVAEFFAMTGSRLDKFTFLLKHGGGATPPKGKQ